MNLLCYKINASPDLAFTILDIWLSWLAEAVLLLRITVVFPRPSWPLLLAFPVVVKAARVAVNIMFSVQWAKLLFTAGSASEFDVLGGIPRSTFQAAFCLELADNW